MDRNLVFSAAMVYGLAVLLPTVHLVFEDQGWGPAFLERIVVGVVSILAGTWLWRAVRGPPKPLPYPVFWGISPIPVLLGLLSLYFAWFTNLPQAIAGQAVERGVFTASVAGLDSLAPRLITSVMTLVGIVLLQRGLRTKKSPEQRKMQRAERRARRQAAANEMTRSGS